jgi:hypothetical protein
MAYATNTTIITLFPGMPQTTTTEGHTATLSLVASHIDRADNLINGKIGKRYDVSGYDTSGSVPPLLQTLSEDIAAFYTFRSVYSGDNQNFNEWLSKFDEAMTMLNELRDGDLHLVNTTGSLIEERSSSTAAFVDSNTKDYTPTFGEDSSLNWEVDPDKLSDLSDSRG